MGAPPLLETVWHQNSYCNNLCLEDPAGPNVHVYSGCVATSMAQVLKFWIHPVHGIGSHSYTPNDGNPEQTANFGETFYNFEHMPRYLDSTSTDEEIFYIAQLQNHCGVAVNMGYDHNGSGANSEIVPAALSIFFGFSQDIKLEYQDDKSKQDWTQMLKQELDLGRPLIYGAYDDMLAGGHSFVCDGYDGNDFFHFNRGWGGHDNGFFAIGALNVGNYTFNTWCEAVFNCYPDGDYFSRPEKIAALQIAENETHNGATLSWVNPGTNHQGNPLTTIDSIVILRNLHVIARLANTTPSEAVQFTGPASLSEGNYKYAVYVVNSSGNSIPVHQSILVGSKCGLFVEMHDSGEKGWYGGSISIMKDGDRIRTVTLRKRRPRHHHVSHAERQPRFLLEQRMGQRQLRQ